MTTHPTLSGDSLDRLEMIRAAVAQPPSERRIPPAELFALSSDLFSVVLERRRATRPPRSGPLVLENELGADETCRAWRLLVAVAAAYEDRYDHEFLQTLIPQFYDEARVVEPHVSDVQFVESFEMMFLRPFADGIGAKTPAVPPPLSGI